MSFGSFKSVSLDFGLCLSYGGKGGNGSCKFDGITDQDCLHERLACQNFFAELRGKQKPPPLFTEENTFHRTRRKRIKRINKAPKGSCEAKETPQNDLSSKKRTQVDKFSKLIRFLL
ncbi:hypothetical protein CEXT_694721 [Caerostris extrusa]|uniref:Uncharacterized protein n=1 Tax=Caerostris extrusa TaxID=172846 RepID=A0AAV4QFN1_CAEEX|nr:hypothetical protein CEXT_694721 [Caerostris extrusa]